MGGLGSDGLYSYQMAPCFLWAGCARTVWHPAFCGVWRAVRASYGTLLSVSRILYACCHVQLLCVPCALLRGARDASSLAAAALAVAVDESRDAALRELLLDRERAAMQAEDLRSFVAERHFTGSLLVARAFPMTWEAAYAQRHADLELAHDAMRAALRAVRQGDDEGAEERLAVEVGDSDRRVRRVMMRVTAVPFASSAGAPRAPGGDRCLRWWRVGAGPAWRLARASCAATAAPRRSAR